MLLNTYKKHLRAALALCFCALLASCSDNTGEEAAKSPYEYFTELSKIPRCTGNEQAASDFLTAFGKTRKFETYQDEMFNTVIKKRGSKGREHEPPVILQAHIDMVCKKEEDAEHDFDADPIVPVITDDGWITAQKRTTLGADNGSGVSIIMAVLASTQLSHPPVEALFTTQEEAGFIGANHFDASLLGGKRFINLDTIEEGVFVVSSKWDGGPTMIIPLEPVALAKIANLPDWPYKADSPLRDKMVEIYQNFYGKPPIIAGINNRVAGVECMAFAARMPDTDMISIGSTIENLHTPNERMNLESYNRVYDYLVKVLERL